MDIITKNLTGVVTKNLEGNLSAEIIKFNSADRDGDIFEMNCLDEYITSFDTKKEPLRMLMMHERAIIIGEWSRVYIDDNMAKADGNILTDLSGGKDAIVLIEKQLINAVSIGFKSKDYKFKEDNHGSRIFYKIDLVEISLVDYPAMPSALITSIKGEKKYDLKIIENGLRDLGLSRKEATTFVSLGKVALNVNTRDLCSIKDMNILNNFLQKE